MKDTDQNNACAALGTVLAGTAAASGGWHAHTLLLVQETSVVLEPSQLKSPTAERNLRPPCLLG